MQYVGADLKCKNGNQRSKEHRRPHPSIKFVQNYFAQIIMCEAVNGKDSDGIQRGGSVSLNG